MALFPSNPVNGQTTTVNGITYTYNTAQTAWIRTTVVLTELVDLSILGNLSVAGNANVGNIGTTQLISNATTGTAPFVVSSTTKVANLNADTVDGYDTAMAKVANSIAVRNTDGNLAANFFIGNGSQLTGIITSVSNVTNGTSNLNIATSGGNVTTSVGGNANILVVTGTGANVNGTLTATGNVTLSGANISLGGISNVKITGGANGQVVTTDGSGNLSFQSPATGGNLTVYTRAGGPVLVPIVFRFLNVIGRSGNVAVPIT